MVKEMSISETRTRLTVLHKDMKQEDTIAITNRGKKVLALMPWGVYESIAETLEILADPELYQLLRQSIKEAEEGKLIPFDEVAKELE
jgi:PHD/YefM family antitoxin component YafN of YafNO toxin-antitoxin module